MIAFRDHRRRHCTFPTKRGSSYTRLSPTMRKSFCKLRRVLDEIVDEGVRCPVTNDDKLESTWEGFDFEMATEQQVLSGQTRVTSFPRGQAVRARGFRGRNATWSSGESNCAYHFKDICERHGQLTDQIKSSLNALGGRGRTGRALERMHLALTQIGKSFDVDREKTVCLNVHHCMKALDNYKGAISEATEAFKELGVFNNNFLGALEVLITRLGVTAAKLEAEYGAFHVYYMDNYLDSMFEPLITDFDTFLVKFATVAEKEIMAIRRTQNFTSQRYLNLTTIATFLSSVTASTLQITADDDGALASVTNTSWLISLTLSTASVINSLFVMTWRQSSVRQPELVLPSLLSLWFQNGPMYTLIAAVLAFSVGLTLLASRVPDWQRTLVSSAIPTAFTGLYACVIFLFFIWFTREQWKARTMSRWSSAMQLWLLSLGKAWRKHVSIVKYRLRRWKRKVFWEWIDYKASFQSSCTMLWSRPRVTTLDLGRRNASDVEIGQSDIFSEETTSMQSSLDGPSLPVHEQGNSRHSISHSTGLQSTAGLIRRYPELSESDLRSAGHLKTEYKPFETSLQFSPHGRFLACAYNDSVAVHDAEDSFSIVTSVRIPGGERAKHISWEPGAFRSPRLSDSGEVMGKLLVVAPGLISVWNIRYSEVVPHNWAGQSNSRTIQSIRADLVGQLRVTVSYAQWTDEENSGIHGLICATDRTVKLFNENFQELRSIELSDKGDINRVIAAAFYRNKYLICLADVPDTAARYNWLFVVNLADNSIKSARRTYRGHTSITVSSAADKVLLHGSDRGVWLIDLRDFDTSRTSSVGSPVLWGQTLGLQAPEEAVTFHGHRDKMIVGYSAGEVVALYYKCDDKYLSALHKFTTTTAEAIPAHPVSFTVNPALDSEPYMFAFHGEDGTITVWSVQSNKRLLKCPSAKSMVVYDRGGADTEEPTRSMGRFVTLDPPTYQYPAAHTAADQHD